MATTLWYCSSRDPKWRVAALELSTPEPITCNSKHLHRQASLRLRGPPPPGVGPVHCATVMTTVVWFPAGFQLDWFSGSPLQAATAHHRQYQQ